MWSWTGESVRPGVSAFCVAASTPSSLRGYLLRRRDSWRAPLRPRLREAAKVPGCGLRGLGSSERTEPPNPRVELTGALSSKEHRLALAAGSPPAAHAPALGALQRSVLWWWTGESCAARVARPRKAASPPSRLRGWLLRHRVGWRAPLRPELRAAAHRPGGGSAARRVPRARSAPNPRVELTGATFQRNIGWRDAPGSSPAAHAPALAVTLPLL